MKYETKRVIIDEWITINDVRATNYKKNENASHCVIKG